MDALKKPRRPSPTPEQRAERARLHETRVEYIADLMRELKFVSGVTTKYLAERWDLPRGYVGEIAVEASRRVRAEVVDPDHVVSTISMNLERLISDAVASGDRHALIKACQVWAAVTGAGAAAKVQVQTDLTSMTPEQLQARKAEIIARLTGREPVAALPAGPEADGADKSDDSDE